MIEIIRSRNYVGDEGGKYVVVDWIGCCGGMKVFSFAYIKKRSRMKSDSAFRKNVFRKVE